jgi:uncharacterized protein (TIGR04255 family)
MTHEVYTNAPAALVVIEVKHSAAEPLDPAQRQRLRKAVIDDLPLSKPLATPQIEFTIGSPGTVQNQVNQASPAPRFITRDQMTAVTFGAESVVVETTNHRGFATLLNFLQTAIVARIEAAPVEGLTRIGIRYVDEIRVPDAVNDLRDWREWVDTSLLGPVNVVSDLGLVPELWQGLVLFDRGEGKKILVRYGPRDGFAVIPGAPLPRIAPPPGPFFLLDTDSMWSPSDEIPSFDVELISLLATDLHDAASELFEKLITSRLRNEVLRHG